MPEPIVYGTHCGVIGQPRMPPVCLRRLPAVLAAYPCGRLQPRLFPFQPQSAAQEASGQRPGQAPARWSIDSQHDVVDRHRELVIVLAGIDDVSPDGVLCGFP